MKEFENGFTPEAVDRLTESASDGLSPEERHLIQDLYVTSQAYAQENQHSLERIWSRFVQSQEHAGLFQEKQRNEPGDRPFLNEGKAMQEKDLHWETGSTSLSPLNVERPGRSFRRTVSIGVAAAVVLLMVLSWALLSYGLRHGSQAPGAANGKTTLAGNPQQAIHSGKLQCSFSDENSGVHQPWQPSLNWSSNGQIATTYNNLKTFLAKSCTQTFSSSIQISQATWSPDAKRLLVVDITARAEVLDASTGRIIASFPAQINTGAQVGQSIWSSNGTQVISVVTQPLTKGSSSVSIQVWDAKSGALIRTLMSFGSGVQPLGLSADGKYIAVETANQNVEIWNLSNGTQVSTIPFNEQFPSALAWSPNDAYLALGLISASEVQIWSVATGKLSTSFKDHDASVGVIGALAWSPDGKYLAESASDVHIWGAKAQKIVATFGKVDKAHWIATLAWSPDSSMLVSSTNQISQQNHAQNTVNVWQLS